MENNIDEAKKKLFAKAFDAKTMGGNMMTDEDSEMNMMMQHERKFNNAIKKYGNRKRSKTGGTRAVVPVDFK